MRRIGPALVALVLVAAACGDDGGSGGGGTLAGLLGLVPDRADTRGYVALDDYERATALAEIEAPADLDDEDALGSFLVRLAGGSNGDLAVGFSGFFGLDFRSVPGWADEFGVSVLAVDQTVVAGAAPSEIRVAAGDFDPGAIAETLRSDADWSDQLDEVEYAGTSYADWGAENDFERVTPARQVGEAGQLAFNDERVIRTAEAASMESVLDAEAGEAESLADDDAFVAAANALGDAEAYTAILTEATWTSERIGETADVPDDSSLLEPFDLLGTGAARVDGVDRLIIVLVNPDDAGAAANAERLTETVENGESAITAQPWSEVLDIVEVSSDGSLTIGVFETETPGLAQRIVIAQDSLVAHL